MSHEQAKVKSVISNQVIKPVAAGVSAYLLNRFLLGDSNNFRSIVLGMETASGVVIGTNIAPLIPLPHLNLGISSTISEKMVETRVIEVGSTIAGTMASDLLLFGNTSINSDLARKAGIVVLADVLGELAVDMIENKPFSYLA
jgi:hypothetical protein